MYASGHRAGKRGAWSVLVIARDDESNLLYSFAVGSRHNGLAFHRTDGADVGADRGVHAVNDAALEAMKAAVPASGTSAQWITTVCCDSSMTSIPNVSFITCHAFTTHSCRKNVLWLLFSRGIEGTDSDGSL